MKWYSTHEYIMPTDTKLIGRLKHKNGSVTYGVFEQLFEGEKHYINWEFDIHSCSFEITHFIIPDPVLIKQWS